MWYKCDTNVIQFLSKNGSVSHFELKILRQWRLVWYLRKINKRRTPKEKTNEKEISLNRHDRRKYVPSKGEGLIEVLIYLSREQRKFIPVRYVTPSEYDQFLASSEAAILQRKYERRKDKNPWHTCNSLWKTIFEGCYKNNELHEFLNSDVKSEEWRIRVIRAIRGSGLFQVDSVRLIRVIRCERQDMRASCEGLRVLVATAQRWMRCSCACMAPVWLATSTGTLNCGAAVVGGEVGRQRDS